MALQFEPIGLEKQKEYQKLLAQSPQIASDYSFLNLWGWAEEYGLRWAWEDDCVWIQQTRPDILYWAPVGPWTEINWTQRIEEIQNGHTTIIRVPEKLAESWRSSLGGMATIEEERAHWDYIYSVSDLTELRGNRYHKKKNLLNQFVKKYEYTYMPFSAELVGRAMDMQEDWCVWSCLLYTSDAADE